MVYSVNITCYITICKREKKKIIFDKIPLYLSGFDPGTFQCVPVPALYQLGQWCLDMIHLLVVYILIMLVWSRFDKSLYKVCTKRLTLVCMWVGKGLVLVSTIFRLGLVRFGLN